MPIANRPGLDALSYRTGTYATFFETMVSRLSNLSVDTGEFDSAGNEITVRPLDRLTTRAQSDPAIALLDAWAIVGDVLTFYDERIAQEGYLRTASERRSVLELARLIGYAPRPGVSATAYLAYTIDEDRSVTPPKGMEVVIPAGSRAQSVPEPNELPQTFETAEPLQARTQWNKLQPRMTLAQTPKSISSGELWLKGTGTNLKPNDPLLIAGLDPSEEFTPKRVVKVEPDVVNDRTKITLRSWAAPKVASAFAISLAEKHEANPLRGATADAAREVLAKFKKRAASFSTDPKGLSEVIARETVPALEELQARVGPRSQKLEPWLREMTNEFAFAHASLAATAIGSTNAPAASQNGSSIFDALKRAPSVLPRTAAQLDRSLATSFMAGADIFGRALKTFQPRFANVLGPALANSSVGRPTSVSVYALRAAASFFGHNTPAQPVFGDQNDKGKVTSFGNPTMANTWGALAEDGNDLPKIALDSEYAQVLPGSLMLIERPGFTAHAANGNINPRLAVVTVEDVSTTTLAALGVSAKVTVATVPQTWVSANSPPQYIADVERSTAVLRGTRIYAQSELLTLAELPITDPICEAEIELDGLYEGLQPGRWVILTGERADVVDPNCDPVRAIPGIPSAELAMISSVRHTVRPNESLSAIDAPQHLVVSTPSASDFPLPEVPASPYGENAAPAALPGEKTHTFITLSSNPAYCYVRETLTIYGNVVKATHGETRRELLGSGDASKPLQSFTLRQPPLTFLPAPTAAGAASTLVVRVNEVQWHEADSLAGLLPNDRQFVTKTDDESKTTVVFGSGWQGARPPTGRDNITAVYRNGIGRPGNVKVGQISQLGTRPLGVKEVINPLRASGGADREPRDQIRKNAPLGTLALDRIVSIKDYSDFTRTFAGIGKASAVKLSDGAREIICVTIAGADDVPIDPISDLYQNLVEALRDLGDPHLIIEVKARELRALVITANVAVLPDYAWEFMEPKIRAALLDTFSFERRELGQDVTRSEVVSAIQRVPGVAFADLDLLATISEEQVQNELLKSLSGAPPGKTGPPAFVSSLTSAGARLCVETARTDFTGTKFSDRIRPGQLALLLATLPETLLLTEVQP
jgi:hypothetical protein